MAPPTSDPASWEANIPNRLSELIRALDEIEAYLESGGSSPLARYLTRLALEEFGTNTIKYGYDDTDEHWIRVQVSLMGDEVRMELSDDGHEFNPCQREDPDPELGLEARTPGGWGISLVKRLATRVEYRRVDDLNVLEIVVPRWAQD